MDNEAPNYASWVPEAGGYVANGKVVSKTPQYDANGRLVDIDVNLLNQSKPSTATTQPQVANTLQGNAGVITANIVGSGTDANAAATSIGSNTSLNLNTANPDESALSSPATKSPVAGKTIVTPEDKANQDYLDAAGRNDYQGMINALIEKGNYDGQDYSTQIENLTKQREQKIMNIDDQYLAKYNEAQQRYNNAKLAGDQQGMAQAQADMTAIASQQQAWRDAVGYQGAMQTAQQREEQDLQIDYEYTYMTGVNQIAQSLTQLVGNYLNFQYDPSNDGNLARAQALVEARMRNSMAATGMYYASTTQYAIAQAIGELVPVYEKMAKEEMLQQINVLQSTASFLMNLEQTQFNMWRDQIELQWEANDEKRKEVQAAIDRANAIGYYTNKDAALVGVEPGSLSQQAKEHEQELLEELEREKRALEQDKTLADYKNKLDLENYEERLKIAQKYGQLTSGGSGGKSGGTKTSNRNIYTYNGEEFEINGTLKSAELETLYENNVNNGMDNDRAILNTLEQAKDEGEASLFLSAIGEDPSKWLKNGWVSSENEIGETAGESETTQPIVPKTTANKRQKEYTNLSEYARTNIVSDDVASKLNDYYANDNSIEGLTKLIKGIQAESSQAGDVDAVIQDVIVRNKLGGFNSKLDEYVAKFGDSYWDTTGAFNDITSMISKYSNALKNAGVDDDMRADYVEYMYEKLVDGIANADKFDFTALVGNKEQDKQKARDQIFTVMDKSSDNAYGIAKLKVSTYANSKIPNYVKPGTADKKNNERVYITDESKIKWGAGTGYYILKDPTKKAVGDNIIKLQKSTSPGHEGEYYYEK